MLFLSWDSRAFFPLASAVGFCPLSKWLPFNRSWKKMTSSLDHSNDFAGLRRRPPLTCGARAGGVRNAQTRSGPAQKGVASRTGMLQSFTSWSEAVSGETRPEGDVPDRPPKNQILSSPGRRTVWGVITYWCSDYVEIRFGVKFSNNLLPFLVPWPQLTNDNKAVQ